MITDTSASRPLRIAVLSYNLRAGGGLSVGRNVVSSLSRVADHHAYLILMPAGVGYEDVEKPTRTEAHYFQRTSAWRQWQFERREMPAMVRAFKPDVVWGLGNFGLRNPGAAQAFLIHKPHYIYPPEFHKREIWRYRMINHFGRRRLARSLPDTGLVFCQTRTVEKRFRESFGYQGRTALMPNAVSRFALQGEPLTPPPVFERLQGKYVLLCVTRYSAHKNLEAFVDLFRRHGDKLKDVVVLLNIREDHHPLAGRLIKQLEDERVREHVINIGPVEQSTLAAYFAHSQGLILPTVLETFGGYGEAMQFERPIMTSDMDFSREVCGDAARFFDPYDSDSICEAILDVKNHPALRAALVAAGKKRMEQYFRDWDSIVRDAVNELEKLV